MKRKAILFGILTALLLAFIWGQSMQPREISAAESGFLMGLLKPLLDPQGRVDDQVFHHYLRKAAHFTEYAALGFSMGGLFRNAVRKKNQKAQIVLSFLACVLAASVDEIIQVFSEARGPKVTDVALDSCGAVFGIAVSFLLYLLIQRHQKKGHPPS